jgi:hypothetical protein
MMQHSKIFRKILHGNLPDSYAPSFYKGEALYLIAEKKRGGEEKKRKGKEAG